MKNYVRILLAIIAVIACLSLVACSADSDYDDRAPEGDQLPTLIHSYNIDSETKEVGALKDKLEAKCNALGGYIEDKNISYISGECDSFDIVYRIPQSKVDLFIDYIEANSEIEYLRDDTSYAEGNSEQVAIERSTLVTKAELLENMLYDNSLSVSEKTKIVDDIAEIHKKIDRIDAAFSDARFATVELSVHSAPTALDNFMSFFIIIFMFAFYPTFVIVAIIVVVVIIKKNKKKKAQEAK
ncbi:MAG: DUF4349 domain-containing protein [Clostridia bacterium]|nr:DUF4349 domain-containing protein [Clostridia bacterium]